MPTVTHHKPGDKQHTFHPGSIKVYRCPKCNREEANPIWLRCPDDDTMLVAHDRIQENSVEEIMNRKLDHRFETPKGKPLDFWEEDMVKKHVTATVRPIAGKGELVIYGNFNRESYQDKVVKIGTGYYRLSDLGYALSQYL